MNFNEISQLLQIIIKSNSNIYDMIKVNIISKVTEIPSIFAFTISNQQNNKQSLFINKTNK